MLSRLRLLADAFSYGILRIRYTAIRSSIYGAFVRTGRGRIAGKFNLKMQPWPTSTTTDMMLM